MSIRGLVVRPNIHGHLGSDNVPWWIQCYDCLTFTPCWQVRDEMEQKAHANFTAKKEAADKRKENELHAALMECPWLQTLERDREICVLFPGQGTQKKGMADQLLKSCPEAKALFDKASDILGYDLIDLCTNGPQEKLDQTLYAQPAVFVTSLAAVEKAKRDRFEQIGRTKMAAGFSLGEYSALVYANAITFEDGLRLVKARAEAMQAAAQEGESKSQIFESVINHAAIDPLFSSCDNASLFGSHRRSRHLHGIHFGSRRPDPTSAYGGSSESRKLH